MDDLESIGVGIPESRIRDAVKALGLPSGRGMTVVDPSEVGLLLVAEPDGSGVSVTLRGHFRPGVAVRVLRAMAESLERRFCTCEFAGELGHVTPCEFAGES